jgi:hypothetical protein
MNPIRQLAFINPNRVWVVAELDKLHEEWVAWAKIVDAIIDHPYNPRTQSEVFADGEANMRQHDVLQAKTLTFLNNNIQGHGFIDGFDGNGCDRTDLRLEHRVKHRLHRLELLRASLQYALNYVEADISHKPERVKLSTPGGTYVHPERIKELSVLQSRSVDLTKLLAILREINVCHRDRCYFALAALIRSVLDHVPPVFGCKSFSEIASSYKGGKSFKESMNYLDSSARKIADQHLHAQARRGEILPNIVQVDFSNDLDVLLAEIVRVLKV